jgi:hypothetical protein
MHHRMMAVKKMYQRLYASVLHVQLMVFSSYGPFTLHMYDCDYTFDCGMEEGCSVVRFAYDYKHVNYVRA